MLQHAVRRKWSSRDDEQHEHWLDFASDAFEAQLIQDIKQVLRVLVLYLPIPIFWALYDQQVMRKNSTLVKCETFQGVLHMCYQGSRWLFQATRMDGSLGSTAIKPDQVGIINPLLIIAITPLFNSFVYPMLKRCGIRTPLQKIGLGGVLIGVAFVISGFVELELEVRYVNQPSLRTVSVKYFVIENLSTNPGTWFYATQFCQHTTMSCQHHVRQRSKADRTQ